MTGQPQDKSIPRVVHLVISLDHGGLERLVVNWTNARNRAHPGSTLICCLDKPGDLAGQVEGGAVVCLGAVRSRCPFDLGAVKRLRRMLSQTGSQAGETPAPQRSLAPGVQPPSSNQQALPEVWGGCPNPPCALQEPPESQAGGDTRPTLRLGYQAGGARSLKPVLHTHNAAAWQYGVLAGLGLGLRHIHTEHGSNPHAGGWVNRLRNALLWRMTTAIVVVAEQVAEQVARLQSIPRKRLTVIPNGIEIRDAGRAIEENPRAKMKIPADAMVIGSVGRLAQVKGADRLLLAFAELVKGYQLSVIGQATNNQQPITNNHFLLLVGDGPEREALEQQASRLGIADRVVFAGYQADPAPCYAAMDLFVLPSRSEGLSISLLEAMAAGVPVAVTDVGENRAVLDNGELGMILPADEGQWPERIGRALGDAGRAEKAARARERVRVRYSQETTLQGYESLYQPGQSRLPGG